mgnify:CR=1 FL=1
MLGLWLALGPAHGGTPAEEAEADRLSEEVQKLAQKGAWSGVERAYHVLVELPVDVDAPVHALAAEAALQGGNVGASLARWEAAHAADPQPEYVARFEQLRSSHAEVYLEGRGASLVVAEATWVPTAQAAVGFAAARIADDGAFHGWLPAGRYLFGGRFLDVKGDERVRLVIPPVRRSHKLKDVFGFE